MLLTVFAPLGLSVFYTTQDHLPGVAPSGMKSPNQLSIKKMLHRLGYNLMEALLNRGSLFPDDARSCRVDKKQTSTNTTVFVK